MKRVEDAIKARFYPKAGVGDCNFHINFIFEHYEIIM